MTDVAGSVEHPESRLPTTSHPAHHRLLQGALVALRAGPALILLILVVVVSLTTPVFFTSRNIGNVFSQTAVIAVLALGQLLVIVSRGIDLSVGATVALSGVVGAIVYTHVHSTALVVLGDPRHRARGRARERARLRARSRPAPVHRHARESQHRPRARALGRERNADTRHAGADRHPRRRHDRLAPVLLLRRRRPQPGGALSAPPTSCGAAGCTRSAGIPTPRAASGSRSGVCS